MIFFFIFFDLFFGVHLLTVGSCEHLPTRREKKDKVYKGTQQPTGRIR